MTDYQILSAVKNNGGTIDYVKLLNLGLSDPFYDPLADKQRIETLIKKNYISGKTDGFASISLTNEGRKHLQTLQHLEKTNKNRTKKETLKKSKKIMFEIFLVVLGAILSYVFSFIFSLFH